MLLRRFLRRVLIRALQKVLSVLRSCLAMGFKVERLFRRVLRRGSPKVVSGRCFRTSSESMTP